MISKYNPRFVKPKANSANQFCIGTIKGPVSRSTKTCNVTAFFTLYGNGGYRVTTSLYKFDELELVHPTKIVEPLEPDAVVFTSGVLITPGFIFVTGTKPGYEWKLWDLMYVGESYRTVNPKLT